MVELDEVVVRKLAAAEPNGGAAKALADAKEMWARGNLARFLLNDDLTICAQEGIAAQIVKERSEHEIKYQVEGPDGR